MSQIVISGTGLFTPPESISNEELVECFNAWATRYNADHAEDIEAGRLEPKPMSDAEFILKASGIRSRHVLDKHGILDPEIMHPQLPMRGNDEPSQMCEMAIAAATQALEEAGRKPSDVDAVLCAASNMQRSYPAVAVEVQQYLGCNGYAYDMNVACASAAFGIQAGVDALSSGNANCVVMVNPEICSGHLNFRDRDSHFIFGDACTAVVLERAEDASDGGFEVLGTRLKTQFSNNIRNNAGFLNRSETPQRSDDDRLFIQEGRKVFKDVVPMVVTLISEHLADNGLEPSAVRRFWLHQANLNMNQLISKRLLGRDPSEEEAPVVLDEYANTSSAGSVIAFHKHKAGLAAGDVAVLCAFGAGYSAGSVILRQR
ncbi:beta-ketoacyl-ACP synthase III [uncultured Abyssibacter sp.]|uniref:beta-ketoacyl-ACP synthase III n=1 Tax=uncultured Abyssibacter sp. TaxID=2320202 RepID=UPI0032B2BE8E